MPEPFEQPCGCSDCEAAVSPAAYLAALLDYALKHIRKNGKDKIDLQFLVDTFHQPFTDLPTDCEAVEKQVRQVRICIEALRSYLGNRPLADPVKEAALAKREGDYGFAVYSLLLSRIGASYEEIRRIRAETAENRKALAERLGIDLTEPRPADLPNDEEQNGDELDQLFLDPSAKPPKDHLLTEQTVEKLFGLGDTTRDPLSEGAKLGDEKVQILRWNLNGVVWGQNTDPEGMVHVAIVNPAASIFRVELYQDRPRAKLVASGEISTTSGTVKLVPENNSRLSGVFDIAYTVDSKAISIAAIPAFLSWQLKHLRTLWAQQDHPTDVYSDDASPALPIIDPDLIGPDDFRMPVQKANPADPDGPFDIWLKRRAFIDTTLSGLKTDRETKSLTDILQQILGNPLPDLDALLSTLTKGSTAKGVATAKDSVTALGLTIEGFTRLMSIRAKDQLASSDTRNDKVSTAEWNEAYSILAQAKKAKQFAAWRAEEEGAGVNLGLEAFWFSVREPQEGDWPFLSSVDQPLIDPDIVKSTGLPEWLSGKKAIALWNARRITIDQNPGMLKQERETKDFDAMLRLALGNPAPGNPLQHDLNTLKNSLSSPDDTVRGNATTQIETELHLAVENFKRLMTIKAANDQPVAEKKPTAAEWAEVYAILTPARKIKHEYPQWAQEEKTAGLVYWKALKARLPRWRANLELRQAWQQSLRVRSQRPIIDPTVIGAHDLQRVIASDAAFDIWKARYDKNTALHDGLRTAQKAAPDALTGLDKIIKEALGFESADLEALDQERQAGHSIEKRLEQLNLVNGAFAYLMKIRGLAKATQPITDSEWETVYATLAQAKIQRAYGKLRAEEREYGKLRAEKQDKHIILSPDLFKIPKVLSTPLSFLDPSTPHWLSTWQARRDWQDTLQSRIEQEKTLTEALKSVISAVEEATLPALCDALIQASDAVGTNLVEQAEWITAKLLIEARAGGCRTTTRVAQALETLQTLIFDLRTGQFKQTSGVLLSLVADHFDEEWKWLGSYATYRAPTFVSLYPENILQPSFLKHQTHAFKELSTRTLRVTPDNACKEATKYADYFRDICSLEIQATCQASTVMYIGEGCNRQQSQPRSMFYMFGRATSGKIYWSAYDVAGKSSAYGQTFWKEVKGFEGTKVGQIVGAMPYRKSVTVKGGLGSIQSSYIHLFCITGNADKQTLKLARLSLDDFGTWDGNVNDLPTPLVSISSLEIVPVQTQSEFTRPGLIFRRKGDNRLYYRQLNSEGVGWEQDSSDWASFYFIFQQFLGVGKIEATLRVNSDLLWFVTRTGFGINAFDLELIELRPGNELPRGPSAWHFDGAEFLGALAGAEDADVKIDKFGQRSVSAIYIFWRDSTGSYYRQFSDDGRPLPPKQAALADLIRISAHSGNGAPGEQMLAYDRNKNAGAFYMYKYADTAGSLVGSTTIRAVPRIQAPLNVPLQLSATNLQQRRQQIIKAFEMNADATASVLHYLHEAYYFVPLQLALALQAAGHHLASLDCFRTVYDYEAQVGPPNQRNIYYGLELDAKLATVPLYQHADGWLLDPLNPHLIAATRRYAYTRFTIMSLVRCLLDFADSEFTQDTAEALAKARTLYLTALDLLNLPELQQKLGICDDLIAELKVEPGKDIPPEVPAAVDAILEDLTTRGPYTGKIADVVKDVGVKLQGGERWNIKLAEARGVVDAAVAKTPPLTKTGSMVTAKTSVLKDSHTLLITEAMIDNTLQKISKDAVNKLFKGIGEIKPIVKPGIAKPPPAPPPPPLPTAFTPSLQFCVPPNPILKALRLHAELNLYKLRTCRNIAGMKRELDAYAAPTDTTSGLPVIGAGGQLTLPGATVIRPSLYGERILRERAKELVQVAAQIEFAMLAALEKGAAERYSMLKARQELGLAQAGVRLQSLRVTRADHGVQLAELQKERADIQVKTYEEWIANGLNRYETEMLKAYDDAAESQALIAGLEANIQLAQAMTTAATASVSAGAAAAAAVGVGLLAGFRGAEAGKLARTQRDAQKASFYASYERRKDEWVLQEALGQQDVKIGEQAIVLAHDDVDIGQQEKTIAEMGVSQAKDVIEFLGNKFTNIELYESMSATLEQVYGFFLRYATAAAKVYENQIAFLRQEAPLGIIKSDYWTAPSDAAGTSDQGAPADRKGLTGSARLLQDIYQLDQYAFETKKRKLPLTKTISLARLAPAEFQRFRETGVIVFATPMEMFDRDFPGHYLRLISRVRTSIIALIPTIDGIHATLSAAGLSRVVIGPDVFQTVPIRRDPEFVALSSPMNATGTFELEQQQTDMLLPFEGSGADSTWEFRMPKAANQFDYRTIADVLVTIEYSSLDSFDYRQQVVQTLNPRLSVDRSFPFRNQFADQWYDLNNPDRTKTPMTVSFQTVREDFPPNLDELKIQQIVLYFSRKAGMAFEVPVTHFRLREQDNAGSVGGAATSIDGIISTRRGNAGSWTAMVGKSPLGEWELALPNNEEMKNRFKNEEIQDILFVITYSGRTPEWPN